MTWAEVEARLTPAPIYWLHTTGPSGQPHAAPVWGVVVGGDLYFYSERTTIKARNVERNPRALVHLESGADVLIVHGVLSDLGRPQVLPGVVEALAEKYDRPEEQPFLPSSDPGFDVMYRFHAGRALAWALPDSEASLRRWVHSE